MAAVDVDHGWETTPLPPSTVPSLWPARPPASLCGSSVRGRHLLREVIATLRLNATVRGLVPLYSTTLISGLGFAMVLPAIPVFVTEFDVSVGAAAQVITAFAVGRFVGTPVSGLLVDRFGSRTAVVGGPAIAGMAAVAAAVLPWFAVVLAAMFVIGAGDVIWAIGREVAGIDLVRLEQRGRLMSGFHGIHSSGLAAGPLVGGILTEQIGYQAIFVVFAGLAAVAVVLGFVARQAHPGAEAGPRVRTPLRSLLSPRERVAALVGLFKEIDRALRATYAVLVFATFSSFVFRMTLQSIFPLYAGAYLGFSPAQVGLLFSISGVLIFVMILPVGFIIDKLGRKWATVPSTGLPALAFVLLPFSDTFLQLAVLVSLMGVANGLSLGSLATSTYDVVPAAARGRLQAARRTIAEVGSVGAPLAGGILANAFNPGVPFLVFAPILLVGALLLAFVGRETLVKEKTPAL